MDHKIITILVEDVSVDAELFESTTAMKITAALPFEGTATRWGDEIYFTIPVTTGQEPDSRVEVDDGELAYWPAGNAFCIFFGPTPTSKDDKPRAYSPVNVFGRILGDATALKRIADGARIRVVQKLDPGATGRCKAVPAAPKTPRKGGHMKDPFKTHGAFSWNELMTTEPSAAKEFYRKLLGWEMEDMNMENMTYTVVKAGSDGIGGIMGIPPEASGAPPQWGAYVTVDNVDQTARAAESLGGKIMMAPRDIPRVGRFAVIQDPQGAVISLITYSLDQDG